MKNRVKVTIAALTIGVLAMCGNMTGYATESADAVSTQADESTDTRSSNQNSYTVTYNLNGGTYEGGDTCVRTYFSESWRNVELSQIKPEKSGYRLTGWWYRDTDGIEQKIETKKTINLEAVFPEIRTATLTAEWTQEVTVTVDGTETGTKVAAGNPISVKTAPSNTLKLDKWVVNASDANNEWELKPNNNEGTIKVEPAEAEKHVINIAGEKTGFGITSDNPYANFVSYWSPQSGKYLVQVKNETGHPLKFSGKTLNDKATSDPEFFEIITELPKKTDNGYFTILYSSIEERVANQNGEYVTYGENNVKVKAYNLTLSANDVERNIKISFGSQTGVTYTNESTFVETLKNGATLSPQDLLDTANNTATRDGFTKYRWTYSVKDINGKSTKAESIPAEAWADGSSKNILERTFDYSFPYYEFEFTPVWQGDVKFKLDIPTGESATIPNAIEGVDVGTEITLPDGPEIKGYTFNGWKLDVPTDAAYKPESSYEVTSANVTFTGSWTVNKYKITWNQGDNESKFDPREVEYKSPVELPIPEKTGYTFTGWKSDVEGDDTLYNKDKSFTMPSHNVTMTAQWQINTYTVTYNGNGGTIGIYTGEDKVTYNAPYEIKNVSGITPTRFGYKFLGWRKNNEGNLLQAGDSFKMPDDNVELVAQWAATSSKSYKMEQGVGYTYNGAFRIKGDPSNYQDNITFYVPEAGEYTFE